jgi:hypothetical protein
MTLESLHIWHREQAERYAWLAANHKTTGSSLHIKNVTRRNEKMAAFHRDAAAVLKPVANHTQE